MYTYSGVASPIASLGGHLMEGTGTNILLSQKGKSSSILMFSSSIRIYAHGVFFYEQASLGKECPDISVLQVFLTLFKRGGGGGQSNVRKRQNSQRNKIFHQIFETKRGVGGGQRIF